MRCEIEIEIPYARCSKPRVARYHGVGRILEHAVQVAGDDVLPSNSMLDVGEGTLLPPRRKQPCILL